MAGRAQERDAAQAEGAGARQDSAGGVPTWRPAKGATVRPNLLSRELAQAQAKELALQEVAEEEQRLLAEAKAAGTWVSAFAKAKSTRALTPTLTLTLTQP